MRPTPDLFFDSRPVIVQHIQRLEESETRMTQSSRLTSEQAERLAKSESANKHKDAEIGDLHKKVNDLIILMLLIYRQLVHN